MSDRPHEELEQDVAAFVLGAAGDDEHAAVRAHIDACPSCRELAERLGRAVARLPLDTDQVEPPARLRQSILAAAGATPPVAPLPVHRRKEVRRLARGHRRPRLPVYAAAAALLAGILIGLGAPATGLLPRPAPVAVQYRLTGSGPMASASGRVISLPADGVTFVDFSGLPAPEPATVYQLWLLPASGAPVSAGVFRPDADGSKLLVLSRDLKGVKSVAVTAEPAPSGSAQPTQQPRLSGSIA